MRALAAGLLLLAAACDPPSPAPTAGEALEVDDGIAGKADGVVRPQGTYRAASPAAGELASLTLNQDRTFERETAIECVAAPCEPLRERGTYRFTKSGSRRYMRFTSEEGVFLDRHKYVLEGDTITLRRDGATADQVLVKARDGVRKVIVFVWDGLRPDAVTPEHTPNLARLRSEGTEFADSRATYPTFTMMNAASFATGAFPGTNGYYGNWAWYPGATGRDSFGGPVDFQQPVFTEDWAVLDALDRHFQGHLLLVGSLFTAAQAAGLETAVVGKSGPAFLQDLHRGGVILDEKMAWPERFAKALQENGYSLPKLTTKAYPGGEVRLASDNGDPTHHGAKVMLADGVTSDPTDEGGSPYDHANEYLVNVFTEYVLPIEAPDLSVLWLRNPDATQHAYGPGSANHVAALAYQDLLLGQVLAALDAQGLTESVNLVIVSDHGHSSVSGPFELFPPRAIRDGAVAEVSEDGYSVSGDVRTADLLTRAGFTAYDGAGCATSPVLSGLLADGSRVYPDRYDSDGSVCGRRRAYHTPSYKVPDELPADAIVIAANGGSDYLYVPSQDAGLVAGAVRFLQGREELGAIFVADRYGALPGTLPLSRIRVENAEGRSPDVIASFRWDDTACIQGFCGIEFESMTGSRGMHGSFSPVDVHNTMIGWGADFRERFVDPLPTGNVDLAPTIAHVLGFELPGADGRSLLEALRGGADVAEYVVREETVEPDAAATGLEVQRPTDPDGGDVNPDASSYTLRLHAKVLERGGRTSTYFDQAEAVRR